MKGYASCEQRPSWTTAGPPAGYFSEATNSLVYVPLLWDAVRALTVDAGIAWRTHSVAGAWWDEAVALLRAAPPQSPAAILHGLEGVEASTESVRAAADRLREASLGSVTISLPVAVHAMSTPPDGYLPDRVQEVLLQIFGGFHFALALDRRTDGMRCVAGPAIPPQVLPQYRGPGADAETSEAEAQAQAQAQAQPPPWLVPTACEPAPSAGAAMYAQEKALEEDLIALQECILEEEKAAAAVPVPTACEPASSPGAAPPGPPPSAALAAAAAPPPSRRTGVCGLYDSHPLETACAMEADALVRARDRREEGGRGRARDMKNSDINRAAGGPALFWNAI